MKNLYLLRHAKSDWGIEHLIDFDRGLSRRGLQDAPKMATWLKEQNYNPEYILCSPAKRTLETLSYVSDTLNISENKIQCPKELYLASSRQLLEIISNIPENITRAMIIGHNPGLDLLLETLVSAPLPFNEKDKLMTTAAFADISMAQWAPMSPHQATLNRLMRPADIS